MKIARRTKSRLTIRARGSQLEVNSPSFSSGCDKLLTWLSPLCLLERGGRMVRGFGNLRLAVGHFVVALVGFHIERHAAFCAFETRFVPCLKRERNKKTLHYKHRIRESEKLLRMQYYYCCPLSHAPLPLATCHCRDIAALLPVFVAC